MHEPNPKVLEGTVHSTPKCGNFKVVSYKRHNNITIKFEKSGVIKKVTAQNILAGRLTDEIRNSVRNKSAFNLGSSVPVNTIAYHKQQIAKLEYNQEIQAKIDELKAKLYKID